MNHLPLPSAKPAPVRIFPIAPANAPAVKVTFAAATERHYPTQRNIFSSVTRIYFTKSPRFSSKGGGIGMEVF
ncbi:hypothetical protein C8R44DRAFT_984219 [Mycena epipterygia]|nr:hypothetical protein C8R44DRAFT_984219 [Mycena epipterygia]